MLLLIIMACNGDTAAPVDRGASGAGAPDTTGPSGNIGLDGDWELVAGIADGTPVPIVSDFRITLSVEGTQLGGTAACNSYGGSLLVEGSRLAVSEIFQTEMACETRAMESESAYLGALLRITSFEETGDELILAGDDVSLEFRRLTPPSTAGLVDTTWVLDSLIEGDTVSSVQGEPAMLIIRSDGTLEGSTGCRRLDGRWVESGDTIQFTEFAALGECPAGLADQDGHVVTVLGDGFTFSIDGNRLTVTAPGGIGLSYRAA